MQVIAHRGASAHLKENTLDAFRLAVEMGADWIELDVRRSRDDVLVIHHDAHISDGRVIVKHDHADLPDDLTTLSEALEACSGANVNIEIKNEQYEPDFDPACGLVEATLEVALAHRPMDELLISSFNMEVVRRSKAINPELDAGLITMVRIKDPALLAERMVEVGLQTYHPYQRLLDQEMVDAAHAVGMPVYPWTVNNDEQSGRMIDLGVDGLIGDDPQWLRTIVDGS